MTPAREIALDLLRRLLGGERGDTPLHLGLLLEKSSTLDHGDEHYRQLLPPQLAGLRLPSETHDEIIATLCQEVSQNPDAAFISVISFSGSDEAAVKVAVRILSDPPRRLTLTETCVALSLALNLPIHLHQNPEILAKADLERLVDVLDELRSVEETGAGTERSARMCIRMHSANLATSLRGLRGFGVAN